MATPGRRPSENARMGDVSHAAPSKWSEAGWPDLALCRPPRLVLVELKSATGKVSPAQARWLGLLGACPTLEVYVWRPDDLDAAVRILR